METSGIWRINLSDDQVNELSLYKTFAVQVYIHTLMDENMCILCTSYTFIATVSVQHIHLYTVPAHQGCKSTEICTLPSTCLWLDDRHVASSRG